MGDRNIGQWDVVEESEHKVLLAREEDRITASQGDEEVDGKKVWYVDGSFEQSNSKSWKLVVSGNDELWDGLQEILNGLEY